MIFFDRVYYKSIYEKVMIILRITIDKIDNMHKNSKCALTIDWNLVHWFNVRIGVRQEWLLLPTLFNVFIEFAFAELISIGTHLKIQNDICLDIHYANDSTPLSAIFEKPHLSKAKVEGACQR